MVIGSRSINNQVILSRDITTIECGWLDRDFKKGEVIYRYTGPTYGCIGPNGTACTLEYGETPFFEIPLDAIDHIGVKA